MNKNNISEKIKKITKEVSEHMKNKKTNYLILALCFCLISTAAIWNYITAGEQDESVKEKEDEVKIVEANEDPYEEYVDNAINNYQNTVELNEERELAVTKEKLELFSRPMEGVIVRESNSDELVYFEGIKEWRIHEGIDITPTGNLNVYASYDGEIINVSSDGTMGVEIMIDHGDEILSLYSCLSSSSVNAGDKIKKGEKIGTLGVVENIEKTEIPHLHYQVFVKGENYNPVDWYEE